MQINRIRSIDFDINYLTAVGNPAGTAGTLEQGAIVALWPGYGHHLHATACGLQPAPLHRTT